MLKTLTITLILFISTSLPSFAGAWLKSKKAGYAQISYTWLEYKQLLNGGNDPYDLKREVRDYTLQFYGEYGIEDNINILLILPFKILSTANNILPAANDPASSDTLSAGKMSAFSNPVIGLKFPLIRKNFVLSGQVNYAPPVFTYHESTGLRSGFDCSMVSPMILFGKGWNRTYLSAEAGYIYKSNNYADFIHAGIEFGYRINWKKQITWLAVVLDAMITTGTPGFDNGTSVQTGLYIDGAEHISPGFKLSQSIMGGFSLEMGIYGALYSTWGGKNPTITGGISYDWE